MDCNRVDIFLAGDSTMCFYTADRAPRTGWGMMLRNFCAPNVRVHNFAQSGCSTKSFQRTGWFDHLLSEVRPGDHVVIQFGHNDKHPVERRPQAHTEVDEFAANLRSWISRVRDCGAIPTLCTTTIEWAPDGLHERAPLLAEYNRKTMETAAACGVDGIDLNSFAYAELSKLSLPDIHQYHMATSGMEGSENDYCHLKTNGAEYYAALFVKLCFEQNSAISTCFIR